ncbi:lysophospholipid acyltransferase family protein [Commensalibacter oyaizuii]|uniref:Lysophospholipid acyltransferase family protein n=1 Tax=Commensalibacter oyaizuii TaxID=3043873 RepID=A0ABT6PYC1_9PROT|nr:lysophospholipid acyltransferase family protein [Commensalibacter sp. TBRC 16381]MDI2089854.1 lysophospholipid acyltransferase family protein [Commensalibacter sp. TBRC 16381]
MQYDVKKLRIEYPDLLPTFSQQVKRARAFRKIAGMLGWTALCIPVQSVFIKFPKNTKIKFARFYWRTVCRILGVELRVFGKIKESYQYPVKSKNAPAEINRPVLYVANHTSWLDIAVAGGLLPASFVAKEETGSWPIISILCRLGRVLYVSRQRQSTLKEQLTMEQRLKDGGSLILFPEGTSTEGSHVLPFLSSFFVLAKPLGKQPVEYEIPVIQPISIVYDRLDMLPVTRVQRPVYSWYGEMELAPHLWDFCKRSHMRASIIFHEPVYPENFKNRKQLAQKTWEIIAKGAATLRQGKSEEQIKETI